MNITYPLFDRNAYVEYKGESFVVTARAVYCVSGAHGDIEVTPGTVLYYNIVRAVILAALPHH